MKKKEYKQPAIKIAQMKQRQRLLQASASGEVNATMNSTWEEEYDL